MIWVDCGRTMFGESGDKLSKAEYLLLCSNFPTDTLGLLQNNHYVFGICLHRFVTDVGEMVSIQVNKGNKHVVWDVL